MSPDKELPFFDQVGLTNVVWLDDLFDPRAMPSDADIADGIGAALAADRAPTHPRLGDLDERASAQEWLKVIRERLSPDEIQALLESIARPEEQGEAPAVDYSLDELEAVVTSLGTRIQRVGLAAWPRRKAELIEQSPGGLFLVDRERLVHGLRQNVGDDIVEELVRSSRDDVAVIVLTHSVGPDGEEGLRRDIATEREIPISRIGVVSKRPEGALLASGVRAAVRTTFTQLTCAIATGRIVAAMRRCLVETEKQINELPIQIVDHALFENSFAEGASEIDVLTRIVSSRQRVAVQSDIIGALDDVQSPLARLRRLRALEPMTAKASEEDAALLRQWRKEEVFDVGGHINALRSPIACGDVFQKEGSNKFWVLLGQPCDLTVRPTGGRAAREGIFARLLSGWTPAPGSEGRYFEVPALEGNDRWALDFRAWAAVNLECLEWTSFNTDGRVAFAVSEVPPHGLLPGWELRFGRARNKFAAGRQYCLSVGDLPAKVATAGDTSVAFPYTRVARLRGPRAAGAFAAFASFHARAAFDHDFAKGLGEDAVSD